MSDRALDQKQYAALLGMSYSAFRSHLARNPELIAPSFSIGGHRRWWESTIVEFHKKQEQGGIAREG